MSRENFISVLIQQKENIQIEFQREYDPLKIIKTICAFLNTDGGWIIVGYSEKQILGISGDVDAKVNELKSGIDELILPQPLIYVISETYQRKVVLLINVLKGTRQPYSFEGKYYIRKGAKSVVADPDDIGLLLRKSDEFTSTWEKQTVIDAVFDDLDLEEIQKTISDSEKFERGKNLPKDPVNFLSYFQLYDFNSVKNGSVALFGNDPGKFLPQCRITITVMPYGKTGSHYKDSLIIDDHLYKAFEQVSNYFKQQLPLVSEFMHDDWNRIDRKQYPLDALDEAIVNAMVHRDYSDISGEVTINIYRDKIDITNSGEIPEGILKSKNSFEIYHAVFRNPMIAQMFFLRGKMDKKGRGLLLIKNRFLEFGLKAPEWISQNGYTSLTLYGIPKSVAINERMFDYLKKLKTGDQFSRDDYEKYFKDQISEKTARIDISRLVESGLLSKRGVGPSTKYTRTNKELPDITG
ncbi:MAG: putative DNA binding domain-containing protein [Bacteroidetes bacterium]|nr:putative DNA binding domain-containing protein [Bacteroidota bacterium]